MRERSPIPEEDALFDLITLKVTSGASVEEVATAVKAFYDGRAPDAVDIARRELIAAFRPAIGKLDHEGFSGLLRRQ